MRLRIKQLLGEKKVMQKVKITDLVLGGRVELGSHDARVIEFTANLRIFFEDYVFSCVREEAGSPGTGIAAV